MSGERINLEFKHFQEDWSDKEAYVIGAGPSLQGFNFDCIPTNGITIGANRSAFVANTDVLCTIDRLFIENCTEDIENFPGSVYIGTVRGTARVKVEKATYIWISRREPFSTTRDHICGMNSGFSCMNLAFLAGCKKIHLLGIDMKMQGNLKHFHGGYQWDKGKGNYKGWIRFFNKASEIMKSHGTEVIQYVGPNGTDLECFKQIPIQELDPNYGT